MNVNENQLKQLEDIQNKINEFIESVKNDDIIIIDGTFQDEINTGNQEEIHSNSLYMSIDYLKKEPKILKPPEYNYYSPYRRQPRRSR